MARLWRDQGQVNPDGEPKVDRNGISTYLILLWPNKHISVLSKWNGSRLWNGRRKPKHTARRSSRNICTFPTNPESQPETKFLALQGLTASARMDPAERERCDMMGWLNQCIDTLNIQVALHLVLYAAITNCCRWTNLKPR